MNEKTLTRSPVEGLFQTSRLKSVRDRDIESYERMGFEIQTWQVNRWGAIFYGFSYSRNRKLSKKQLDEFQRLEEK